MPKLAVDINITQIREVIGQLEKKDRIKLITELEKDTWQDRFNALLSRIDKRVKNDPISEEEIASTVESVREELYDKSRH